MSARFHSIVEMIRENLIFQRGSLKNDDQAICSLRAIIIFLLLASFAIQTSSCDTTATVTITAIILPAVEVSRPSITWDLNPTGPGAFTRTERVLVKANTDWQLLAEDCDPATSGHLAEWTGTGYGPSRLHNPVRIASSSKVSRPITAGKPIETGSHTGEEGRLVNITLTQMITPGERPMSDGRAYRIVVNLKAEPMTEHSGLD